MAKELLWVSALVLLLWCPSVRKEQPQSQAHPVAKAVVALAPADDTDAHPAPAQGRPSAFPEQPKAEPLPGRKVPRTSSPSEPKSGYRATAEPRPFEFSLPPASADMAGRKAIRELPAPPTPLPVLANTVPSLGYRREPCEFATATYEPAKAGRMRGLVRKIPGIHGSSAKDFVPARPLQEITFMLPLGSSPGVVATRRMDLKATVDPTGAVTRVELISPREEQLVEMASYAASQWKFSPAQANAKPVASEVILHFNFYGNRP